MKEFSFGDVVRIDESPSGWFYWVCGVMTYSETATKKIYLLCNDATYGAPYTHERLKLATQSDDYSQKKATLYRNKYIKECESWAHKTLLSLKICVPPHYKIRNPIVLDEGEGAWF